MLEYRPLKIALAAVGTLLLSLFGLMIWIGATYLYRPTDLLVCQGENEDACSYHTDFVSCAGSLETVAKKACSRYEIMSAPEFESKGGKCDYRTTRVICKR